MRLADISKSNGLSGQALRRSSGQALSASEGSSLPAKILRRFVPQNDIQVSDAKVSFWPSLRAEGEAIQKAGSPRLRLAMTKKHSVTNCSRLIYQAVLRTAQ